MNEMLVLGKFPKSSLNGCCKQMPVDFKVYESFVQMAFDNITSSWQLRDPWHNGLPGHLFVTMITCSQFLNKVDLLFV